MATVRKLDASESPAAGLAPTIQSIDLGAFLTGTALEQREIAAQVDEICRRSGFLIVANHGVPGAIIDNAWAASRAFFDLPLEKKLASKSPDPACPRGYFPLAAEALAKSLGVATPPDIKESFGVGPLKAPPYAIASADYEFHYGANIWPTAPEQFRSALTSYFHALTMLGSQVLQLFAAALGLPLSFFEQYHTHPMCALRCINYPCPDAPLLPGQRGAGEHSDYGSITILKPDPDVPGLEIKLPSGQWAEAPLVEDAFIVNIGDMMARWTNDRWVSTLHRVTQPTATECTVGRRRSMPFFHNTSFDAKIECIPTCLEPGDSPKYAAVLAGQYLVDRFSSAVN